MDMRMLMNVAELKQKVNEKFPNLDEGEKLMYMDGYIDGRTDAEEEHIKRMKEILDTIKKRKSNEQK